MGASVASASGRTFQTFGCIGHAQVVEGEGVVKPQICGLGLGQVGRGYRAGVMAVAVRTGPVHGLLPVLTVIAIAFTGQSLVCGRTFHATLGRLDDRAQSEQGDEQREQRHHPPGSGSQLSHLRGLADFCIGCHAAAQAAACPTT